MKISDIKLNHKFEDVWYPEFGVAKVVKIFKTCVRLQFSRLDSTSTYDQPHLRFLKKVK
jgi:hypothetical protein